MDVTCERCNTEYEFDDALVSERGTTVKCTTCGHQFKVRRSDGVNAPERWVVRTVDGREMEFTALRELQGAITHARITRDDVLARGSARPRRLGSIAELEPFFAGSGGISMPSIAPGPHVAAAARSRTLTPAGLGIVAAPTAAAAARFEGSVAIPLPTAPRRARAEEVPPAAERPPAPRPLSSAPRPAAPRPASVPPALAQPPAPIPSIPSLAPAALVSPAQAALAALSSPPPRAEPPVVTYFPPPFQRTPSSPPMPPPAPPAPPPEGDWDVATHAVPRLAPVPVVDVAPPPREEGMNQTVPHGTPEQVVHGTASGSVAAGSAAGGARPSASTPSPETPMPYSPETPMPYQPRVSHASFTDEALSSDPRFTGPVASRRSGGARLIIGFFVAGLVVFLGATVGRKYLTSEAKPPSSAAGDERIASLLRDSDRSLQSGDLETANDQLVKASALGEKDPRVAAALARLAAIRADRCWLLLRLVPAGDADEAAARRDLDEALGRLKAATARAVELAPAEPAVIRAQIDGLRMAGDRDGARKLVASLGSAASQPESALSLSAIDLTEDKPSYGALVERLRTAAAGEENLGRARAMLVYALARSGDVSGAKVELDRLVAAPRSTPVAKPLQAFVARAEKDSAAPDVAAVADGPSDEIPSSYQDCLRLAAAAKKRGDPKRAEMLYSAALKKHPGDSDAIAGLASLPARKDAPPHINHVGGAASPPAVNVEQHPVEGAVPDNFVAPQQPSAGSSATEHPSDHVDTSDLPGVKAPPKATTAPEAPPAGPPPGIDTSDLPGLK